jgi:hypothetical protein
MYSVHAVHNDTSLKELVFSVVELEVVLAVALVGVLPAHLETWIKLMQKDEVFFYVLFKKQTEAFTAMLVRPPSPS